MSTDNDLSTVTPPTIIKIEAFVSPIEDDIIMHDDEIEGTTASNDLN